MAKPLDTKQPKGCPLCGRQKPGENKLCSECSSVATGNKTPESFKITVYQEESAALPGFLGRGLLALVIVLVMAAGGYLGWTHFKPENGADITGSKTPVPNEVKTEGKTSKNNTNPATSADALAVDAKANPGNAVTNNSTKTSEPAASQQTVNNITNIKNKSGNTGTRKAVSPSSPVTVERKTTTPDTVTPNNNNAASGETADKTGSTPTKPGTTTSTAINSTSGGAGTSEQKSSNKNTAAANISTTTTTTITTNADTQKP